MLNSIRYFMSELDHNDAFFMVIITVFICIYFLLDAFAKLSDHNRQ